MNFAISLTIEEKQIAGIIAKGDMICAEFNSVVKTHYFAAIHLVLSELLSMSAIPPEQIKTLLITADFLELFAGRKLPHHKIGYIRYLPKSNNLKEKKKESSLGYDWPQ